MRLVILLSAMLAGAAPALADGGEGLKPIELPALTGKYPVGVMSYHWIDGGRRDILSANPDARREMMAHVWYPAKLYAGDAPTPYRPIGGALSNVRQHAVGGAAFAEINEPAPVILLCPGRGMPARYYVSVAEDLASRGYAVLGVDSLRSGSVSFPDGRHVGPSDKYAVPFELLTGPYEKVDEFFEEAATYGADDMRFAVRQLAALNRHDPGGRFARHLDMKNLGAFGHSLGGRICGAVAGGDGRVKAFAAMEGVPPRDVRQNGMRAAVALIYGGYLPEEMALPNMEEVIPKRKNDVFIFKIEGFGHNSVTDRPLVRPGSYDYEIDPVEGLALTRRLLGDFFDAYLRNGENPAAIEADPRVTARKYPKSR